jgi:hypothetical protein
MILKEVAIATRKQNADETEGRQSHDRNFHADRFIVSGSTLHETLENDALPTPQVY